ncbi:Uncharacterised protein [Mycobacteroides abscessus]|nr:Uncharacterised protein [Mycobacteroides abscessus]
MRASKPESAASFAGMVSVSTGSTIATVGVSA